MPIKDIERVRTEIAQILQMDRNFVLYRGGEETHSFLLTFMVQNKDRELTLSETSIISPELCDIGVDFLRIGEREIAVYPTGIYLIFVNL